ncbi:hypothetical protein [Leptospira yasudae]|uniref:Uncharacterized protein n=1 Tax=Leptospira yasudae TaxID=2202201 RepID=A0A6N4QXI0_9LEPT|nr:hypothetical protein [Leptospira yasudae]TGL80274.1 hypothetical protein EHQ77_08430 [Leptospira yasudae]TGL82151.1 hypothetical protein EHQ72_04385 [Leptospira yasudae]TGL86973.1 hypothetical protein EHQ83_05275 [Leptospira yasudae]
MSKILSFLIILGFISFNCYPESHEKANKPDQLIQLQMFLENSQSCQVPGALKFKGDAKCFSPSDASLIYNQNTSSLISTSMGTVSNGAKLECRCPAFTRNEKFGWYRILDSQSIPNTIELVPSSYFSGATNTMIGYSVGDTLVCAVTTICREEYVYQKITIAP